MKEAEIIRKIIELKLFNFVRASFLKNMKHAFNIEKKQDGTLVTSVDKKVEKIILNVIKSNFPDDYILSEESFSKINCLQKRVWIIDPICGTKNLAFQIPAFTTSIALLSQGKPIFSLIVDYINKDYFWAIKEKNGVFNRKGEKIRVFKNKAQKEIVLDYGYLDTEADSDQKSAFFKIARELYTKYNVRTTTFSTALVFAYAALNRRFSGFIIPFTKPWDFVPAAYLMEKSGGIVTNFEGQPYSCKDRFIIAALNKPLYKVLLNTVGKFWKFE